MNAYASSKRGVAFWMRREATGARWAGAGIPLNGVAPGTVKTPMTLPLLGTEEGRAILAASTPIAVPDYADPRDLAETLAFLLTMETRYIVGQLLFADGGTDALMRATAI
jgi:NAD(P)-dependent dehydrogenase (short-subunit alcohol dehydrogenase family)